MSEIKLLLLGFGNVGQALTRLLLRKREALKGSMQIQWRIVGIATGRHGAALDPEGIDVDRALMLAETGGSLDGLSSTNAPDDMVDLIRASGADVMFENTPVNYECGQPAVDHVRTALEAGMHAITANKGPVVHAYRQLTDLAASTGRRFLFESAVMDGAPVFSLWRHSLPAADLYSFRGVLNSTTNMILSMMEEGISYEEALAHAQEIGIAETDPSGDIEGWDAAVKVAALVTVLMGIPLTPDQVNRKGISGITAQDVSDAQAAGRRWKLVCEAELSGRSVEARVHPEKVGPDDPLFTVMGTSSAVTFHSDVLGALTIVEDNPGPETTAYGLLADFINAVRKA
jgi:homoserine dehydrogenase